MTVYLISDTHFGHDLIVNESVVQSHRRHHNSIEAHDEALVDNWNRVVGPRDTVYHLGDVLFKADRFPLLKRLNGTKKLVMGNHDDFPTRLYLEAFDELAGAVKYKGMVLTHIPVHPAQMDRFHNNIHGHLHSHVVGHPKYLCVSCDHIGFAPIAFDEAVERLMRQRRDGMPVGCSA